MKIKEIHVERSSTVNTGNYNSERFTAGVTIELEDGDDPDTVFDQAFKNCDRQIELQLGTSTEGSDSDDF